MEPHQQTTAYSDSQGQLHPNLHEALRASIRHRLDILVLTSISSPPLRLKLTPLQLEAITEVIIETDVLETLLSLRNQYRATPAFIQFPSSDDGI